MAEHAQRSARVEETSRLTQHTSRDEPGLQRALCYPVWRRRLGIRFRASQLPSPVTTFIQIHYQSRNAIRIHEYEPGKEPAKTPVVRLAPTAPHSSHARVLIMLAIWIIPACRESVPVA